VEAKGSKAFAYEELLALMQNLTVAAGKVRSDAR
jgi:hypothetical protein